MKTKHLYTAPLCDIRMIWQTAVLCDSRNATLQVIVDDPDDIEWNS